MKPPRLFGPTLSLRWQLTLAFASLVIGLAVVLSLTLGQLLKARIRDQAEVSLSVIATNVARSLSRELEAGSLEVQKLAGLEAVWSHGLASPAVRQMLATAQANTPGSSWIGVADAGGVVRASTGGLLEGVDVRQRPWFGAGLQGLHVGDVHGALLLSRLLPPSASGEPLRFVDFAVPVRHDGRTLGVLAVHGSWDRTHGLIEALLPEEARARQIAVFVFDRRGQLIYGPGGVTAPFIGAGQRMLVLPEASPERVESGRDRTRSAVLNWVDGRPYLTTVTPVHVSQTVADLGWQVVVREPADLAFEGARRATGQALGLGLLAALAGSVLAWGVSARLSRPLAVIAKAAHRVQAGRHDARIPLLAHSTEVRTLSHSLHAMTEQLLAANHEMENTVRQRTHELRAANDELARQASSDALTGLLNRRGFEPLYQAAIAQTRRSGRPLALAMIDIDHFKRVNDTLGHDTGDRVLVALASLLRQRVRAADVLARLGGEEFALLLSNTDVDGAEVIGQALVSAVAGQLGESPGSLTVSIGVAQLGAEDDAGRLMRQADAALYRAKREGRNRVCRAVGSDAGGDVNPSAAA